MKEKVTFVLTSCGRPDLLDKTLESFFHYNTFKFDKLYLVEDSINNEVYQRIKGTWGNKIDLIFNKHKKGQIKSIIDTYKLIKTPYVFHCEDDWIYTRPSFVEECLKVLEYDEKIIQMWLESEASASRIDIFYYDKLQKYKKIGFKRVHCIDGWEWGYFSFRPGVKRMKDYNLINGYNGYLNELDIGVTYKKLGFYSVIAEIPAVEDIGDAFHVKDPTRVWPKRRKTNAPTGLKRLWGHIKRLKF